MFSAVLYSNNAYNVQKVLWFIAELELDCVHVEMGSEAGDLDSDEFLAMNPHGRAPVLMDHDRYIWESNTILGYLASTHGSEAYRVESPYEQSLIERWMDWELASFQPDFLSLFWKYYRTPENKRDSDAIIAALKRCERNMIILNAHLQNNCYVSGSEFSLADICMGTSFYRLLNMEIEGNRPVNPSFQISKLLYFGVHLILSGHLI